MPPTGELLEELAVACRELARQGHEDGNLAHLAVRDPEGRGVWMKRSGIGIGEVGGPDDFVLLDFAGEQIAGSGNRHLEWPIHVEIMRARPEVNATAHSHAFPLRLFAAADQELRQLIAESTAFFAGGLPRYEDTTRLIDTPALGRGLAAALGEARAVIMKNHGATTVGRTVAELCMVTICLTRAVEMQAALAATGWPLVEIPAEEALEKGEEIYGLGMVDKLWSYYVRADARRRGDEAQ
jgi:L-fuculose-phosphate aldolase